MELQVPLTLMCLLCQDHETQQHFIHEQICCACPGLRPTTGFGSVETIVGFALHQWQHTTVLEEGCIEASAFTKNAWIAIMPTDST